MPVPAVIRSQRAGTGIADSACNDADSEGSRGDGLSRDCELHCDHVLEDGAAVLYEDRQSGGVLEATVCKVHYDDTMPYYSVRLAASGQTRQTVRERLRRLGGPAARASRRARPRAARSQARRAGRRASGVRVRGQVPGQGQG